jgi:hypothetical protein
MKPADPIRQRQAMTHKLDRRMACEGKLTLPAVPSMLDDYTRRCAELFAAQGRTLSEAELAQLEPGPVRHAAIKRCLSRGHMGVTPAPHFSLGLAAYVQATSPIRRYGDLLVQRQLAALADGQVPLQEAELAALKKGRRVSKPASVARTSGGARKVAPGAGRAAAGKTAVRKRTGS